MNRPLGQPDYAELREATKGAMRPVLQQVYEEGAASHGVYYRAAEQCRLDVEAKLRENGLKDQKRIDQVSLRLFLEGSRLAARELFGHDSEHKTVFYRSFGEMMDELRQVREGAAQTVYQMSNGLINGLDVDSRSL